MLQGEYICWRQRVIQARAVVVALHRFATGSLDRRVPFIDSPHTHEYKQQSQEWRARVKFRPWKLLPTPTPSISRITFTHAPIQCNSVKSKPYKKNCTIWKVISVNTNCIQGLLLCRYKYVCMSVYICLYIYSSFFFLLCESALFVVLFSTFRQFLLATTLCCCCLLCE